MSENDNIIVSEIKFREKSDGVSYGKNFNKDFVLSYLSSEKNDLKTTKDSFFKFVYDKPDIISSMKFIVSPIEYGEDELNFNDEKRKCQYMLFDYNEKTLVEEYPNGNLAPNNCLTVAYFVATYIEAIYNHGINYLSIVPDNIIYSSENENHPIKIIPLIVANQDSSENIKRFACMESTSNIPGELLEGGVTISKEEERIKGVGVEWSTFPEGGVLELKPKGADQYYQVFSKSDDSSLNLIRIYEGPDVVGAPFELRNYLGEASMVAEFGNLICWMLSGKTFNELLSIDMVKKYRASVAENLLNLLKGKHKDIFNNVSEDLMSLWKIALKSHYSGFRDSYFFNVTTENTGVAQMISDIVELTAIFPDSKIPLAHKRETKVVLQKKETKSNDLNKLIAENKTLKAYVKKLIQEHKYLKAQNSYKTEINKDELDKYLSFQSDVYANQIEQISKENDRLNDSINGFKKLFLLVLTMGVLGIGLLMIIAIIYFMS